MALDVWVGDWNKSESKLVVSFDPKVYYSFLSPLFEEFEKTYGQMIVPYDDAMFEPGSLGPVFELVDNAEALVSSQAEQFEVHMGTNLGTYFEPKKEEIYCTVHRDEFLEFIQKLRSAVRIAQQTGKPLIFYGD